MIGILAIFGLIPIAVQCVVIWGFSTQEAKEYYEIDKDNKKTKDVISEGMDVTEVEKLLEGNYDLESKDLIFRADDGEIFMHSFCDKKDTSRVFSFESKNGKITKIY